MLTRNCYKMKSLKITFLLFYFSLNHGYSQALTFYQDVQPIFQKKCFTCHQKKKNNFLFDTYSMTKSKSSMIKFVIEENIMPPWPANNSFQSYKHVRSLSEKDKKTLVDWLNGDMLMGKPVKSNYKIKIENYAGYKSIQFPHIKVPVSERDTIIPFSIPFVFSNSYMIDRIVFKSKRMADIHHINLFIIENGKTAKEPSFVYGYVPGIDQEKFSDGLGFSLPKQGSLSGDIHIPPLTKSIDLDLTILFKEASTNINHTLFFLGSNGVLLDDLEQFIIPHDSIMTVTGSLGIKNDVYITHIVPHMHLLGKSIEVWYESRVKSGPLIKIDRWEFNWQNFYEFESPVFVPSSSIIKVKAVYDNTINNEKNPNNPPRDVSEGWYTSQEMLAVYMLAYLANE